MFTAVGFTTEGVSGFSGSRPVTNSRDPQAVADQMAREFGTYFEQILVLENGESGPIVTAYWTIDDDYKETEVRDELLAALRELVLYDEGSSEQGSYGHEVLLRCKAAIAKAEGRSE